MAAVIAAVLALLATPTSNAVAVAPGESFPGYAYDGTRASEPFDDTAAERGPPGPNDRAMTYDAVDRWSHGASASPDIATPGATRTYTAPGGPPQVVEAAGKTQAGARADVGGLSSLARAGVAANGGMAGVRATGATGEAMAGIVKNTTRIPSASGKAAYRIPDELNSSVLGEVKNVKSLGWSSQISDFYNYATARGLESRLYVRPDTVFRGQLAKLYEYDGFTRVDVPGMGP